MANTTNTSTLLSKSSKVILDAKNAAIVSKANNPSATEAVKTQLKFDAAKNVAAKSSAGVQPTGVVLPDAVKTQIVNGAGAIPVSTSTPSVPAGTSSSTIQRILSRTPGTVAPDSLRRAVRIGPEVFADLIRRPTLTPREPGIPLAQQAEAATLLNRFTMGPKLSSNGAAAEILRAATYASTNSQGAAERGPRAYLKSQLDLNNLDFGADIMSHEQTSRWFYYYTWMCGGEGPTLEYMRNRFYRDQAIIMRGLINSERSMLGRLMVFWYDWFTIRFVRDSSADREMFVHCAPYLVNTLLRNSLGKFKDLLWAVTLSHPMLLQFNTFSNTQFARNENHARELMVLHTVGQFDQNGNMNYTSDELITMSKLMTGLILNKGYGPSFTPDVNPNGTPNVPTCSAPYGPSVPAHHVRPEAGTVALYYDDRPVWRDMEFSSVDYRAKSLPFLNWSTPEYLPSQQLTKLREVTDLLASHPSTVHRICTGLVKHFLTMNVNSPAVVQLINTMKTVYAATDGNIKAVLESMIDSQLASARGGDFVKQKRPYNHIISAYRAAGLSPSDADVRTMIESKMPLMGENLWIAPDVQGYLPDTNWISDSGIVNRIDLMMGISSMTFNNATPQRIYNETVAPLAATNYSATRRVFDAQTNDYARALTPFVCAESMLMGL